MDRSRIEPDDPSVQHRVEAIERWLARDPSRTRALADAIADALEPLVGLRLGGLLQSLRPVVVPRGRAAAVARAVRFTAVRLARALGDRERTRALPALSLTLDGADPPTRRPEDLDLLRPDGALYADGSYAMMELNAGSCVGGLVEIEALSDVMSRWYGDAVPLRWPRPATDAARMLVRRYGRGARVAWTVLPGALQRGDGLTEAGDAFARACAAEGLRCDVVEADALRYDGHSVSRAGSRVDVVWRLVTPAAWCRDDGVAHLRAAARDRRVEVFSSPFELVLNHKGALAWLSQRPRDLRGVEVPWTRFARPAVEDGVDLLPMVRARPDAYVLKPCIDRQGRRVVIGREAKGAWPQHLVASVLADDCVVQSLVEPPRATLPYLVDASLARVSVGVVTSPVVIRGAGATLCARTSVPGATGVLTHPYAGTTGLLPIVEVA